MKGLLGALVQGIGCHALKTKQNINPTRPTPTPTTCPQQKNNAAVKKKHPNSCFLFTGCVFIRNRKKKN